MKLGPCLRNSVVSPKTGQPIVPGGKPFLLYLTSFHLKRTEQKQSTKTTTRIAMKIAIIGTLQILEVEDTNSVEVCTHIYKPLSYHLHMRVDKNCHSKIRVG